MAAEPLLEISSTQWPALRDLYQTNWPYGVEGFCLLNMLITNPTVATSFNVKVYCPNGEIERGMIAISDTETYHVYICPIISDNLQCMEDAFVKTGVIDWKRDIIVPAAMPDVIKMIDRVGNVLKLEVKCNGFVIKYLYSFDKPQFGDLEPPPPDTYVGPLKAEHLGLVDSTWTFHSETSIDYFRRLMDINQTYVLYCATSNQPVAWVAIDETGALSHLYSLERCRRQGYASYITKIAANDLLKKGQNVLAYSLMDNFASQRFFVKLGFRNLGLTSWIFISRKMAEVPSCSYCRIVEFHPNTNCNLEP